MKKPILPSEIVLRFHPSKFLWGWWLLFSIAVLVCLWICLPLMWAASMTLIYNTACFWQWTQLVGTHWKLSVQTLKVDVFGQMFVKNTLGQYWHINVLPDTFVHQHCIVLHIDYLEQLAEPEEAQLKEKWVWRWMRPTRLLILFNQTDCDAHRELRVWLKWNGQFNLQ
jgi:hypothetical protein